MPSYEAPIVDVAPPGPYPADTTQVTQVSVVDVVGGSADENVECAQALLRTVSLHYARDCLIGPAVLAFHHHVRIVLLRSLLRRQQARDKAAEQQGSGHEQALHR